MREPLPPAGRPDPAELRREPRFAASGGVRLKYDHEGAFIAIDAQLVDRSNSGFRASHACEVLRAGRVVEFEFNGGSETQGSGWARVIWTRRMDGAMQSGFFIVVESDSQ